MDAEIQPLVETVRDLFEEVFRYRQVRSGPFAASTIRIVRTRATTTAMGS